MLRNNCRNVSSYGLGSSLSNRGDASRRAGGPSLIYSRGLMFRSPLLSGAASVVAATSSNSTQDHQMRSCATIGGRAGAGTKKGSSTKRSNHDHISVKPRVYEGSLHVGDVELPIVAGAAPERVPLSLPDPAMKLFPPNYQTMAYLRWMAQKEILGQDMCIVGEPGPTRRWLALTYAHYSKREVQMLCLSRDTTESDVKQRKEIRNGSLVYEDQAVVQAALNGHLLIIEGLERAERNVLPVINNLLENREMHLDNGMMLIHPARYDQLASEHGTHDLSHLGLLRVSEHFRVIGLTVPVPRYPGNPLDPPLRSRFQCLYLHPSPQSDSPLWSSISSAPHAEHLFKLKHVISAAEEGGKDRDKSRKFPDLGDCETLEVARQQSVFGEEPLGNILARMYPWELYSLQGGPRSEISQKRQDFKALLKKYSALPSTNGVRCTLVGLERASSSASQKQQHDGRNLLKASFSDGTVIEVPAGENYCSEQEQQQLLSSEQFPKRATFTESHFKLFHELAQSHAVRRHSIIVGGAGCGKTAVIREFATLFGYDVETMHLFADMSARDLLQTRMTDPKTGNTTWELSGMSIAMKYGKLAVLDGVDQLPSGMLAVLQELLVDGSITLHDGSVFKSASEYQQLKALLGDLSDDEMSARGIFQVHPSFRVIATARPPSTDAKNKNKNWLTPEVPSMFNVVVMNELQPKETVQILLAVVEQELTSASSDGGGDDEVFQFDAKAVKKIASSLVALQETLRDMGKADSKMPSLSLRQMLRICTYAAKFPEELASVVHSTLMLPLMSPQIADRVVGALSDCGFTGVDRMTVSGGSATKRKSSKKSGAATLMGSLFGGGSSASAGSEGEAAVSAPHQGLWDSCDAASQTRKLHVGETCVLTVSRQYDDKEKSLVPHVSNFYPNRQHQDVLAWVAKNYAAKNKLLLVGNQGVGKNKIVDYFLSHAGIPRHYLQLHRDTTVTSLTINPSVIGGKVIWQDSPLVKAVVSGHTLVVDEIDKAPIEVVQTLKGLIEDREMKLGDGRKISGWGLHSNDDEKIVPMHPDFRMIVLANPPGFPFHGNDFYRQCGDLFASYVMQNPDDESQADVLQRYAPTVPHGVILCLVRVFRDLSKLYEDGALQYPFSLRELIAVVKHLEAFPQDGLFQALNNVFNFDVLDVNTMDHVRRLLHANISNSAAQMVNGIAKEVDMQKIDKMLTLSIPPPTAVSGAATKSASDSSSSEIAGIDLPAEFSSFASSEMLTMPCSQTSYPINTAAPSNQSNDKSKSSASAFTETQATVGLTFLGEHDRAIGIVVLPSAGLTSILVTQDVPADEDASNPNKLLLCTLPDPGGDINSIGKRSCPLAPGRVATVDLSEVLFSAENSSSSEYFADVEKNVKLLGYIATDVATASLVALSVRDPAAGEDRFVLVNPLTGEATSNTFFGKNATDSKNDDASKPLLMCARMAKEGIVTAVHENIMKVFFHGRVIAVTLPAIPADVSCFAPQLIHVSGMSSGTMTGDAILKFTVFHDIGGLRCLMYPLQLGNGETDGKTADASKRGLGGMMLVGYASSSASSAQSSSSASGPLTADELQNAVVVPRGGPTQGLAYGVLTSSSTAAGGSGGGGGVRSLSVTGYTPTGAGFPSSAAGGGAQITHSFDSSLQQMVTVDAASGRVAVANAQRHTSRAFSVPALSAGPGAGVAGGGGSRAPLMDVSGGSGVALAADGKTLSSFEANSEVLQRRFEQITGMMQGRGGTLGAAPTPQELNMWYSKPKKAPSGSLKHGKEDPDNTPHVGGNTWAGGTGGTDTAGLGGLVGPYRLDKGHTVHQVDPAEKKKVPQHIIDEAKKMGKAALTKRLQEISMTNSENEQYRRCYENVRGQVHQLQAMFSGLKAKEGERVWVRHQTDGVWDDAKIVEGITGEKNIYKKRGEADNSNSMQHKKKKRLLFVMDVSASMYRFNGMDGRLSRLVESAIMIMESFLGHEEKIDYALVGHSGDSDNLPLVGFGNPPSNKKERMDVCMKMIAYSQHCWTGDNTVRAMRRSISTVTAEDADSYFVFVISDANLAQYGITTAELSSIIRTDEERVHMFCIFIASFGAQASQLQRRLPPGHGFECMDTHQLPLILKQIFTSTDLLGA